MIAEPLGRLQLAALELANNPWLGAYLERADRELYDQWRVADSTAEREELHRKSWALDELICDIKLAAKAEQSEDSRE